MILAIIPVKRFANSKSRLSTVLSVQDRIQLGQFMLEDTLKTLVKCRSLSEIVVVSADEKAGNIAKRYGVSIISQVQDEGVNSAVAEADRYAEEKKKADATIVIPQDLPLLGAADVDGISSAAVGNCIVICPSLRYDGTNLLLRMPPRIISTSYDNNSYDSHIMFATAKRATVQVIEQEHLMFDIDTEEDARQLVHMDQGLISAKNVASFLKDKLLSFH